MKSTGALLKKLRALMKNLNYVADPLNAYIVTSSDAHSVSTYLIIAENCGYHALQLYFRTNTWQNVTKDEISFLDLLAQQGQLL